MARLGLYASPWGQPAAMQAAGYVWWPAQNRWVQRTGLVDINPITREECYQHYDYDTCTGMKWPIPDGNAHPLLPPAGPVSPGPAPSGGGMLRGFNDGPVERRTLGIVALIVLGAIAARKL